MKRSTPAILIISNTVDPTADFVVRELRTRETPFVRLNTDEFPRWIRGTVSIAGSNIQRQLSWDNRNQEIDLESIKSVWYRRPVRPHVLEELSTDFAKFVGDECYDFIRGLWYSLKCFWVSPPDFIRQAEHKVYQLTVAAQLGLSIPRTVISNDPQHISEFVASCKNGAVAKPVYMGFIDNPPRTIFTTIIGPEDIRDSESLRVSPVIFQEFVPKVSDIRVTVIGNKVFSTEIKAKLSSKIPDWRSANFNDLHHSRHELPSSILDQCLKLVRELGLEFGAIDLGLREDGSYAFFEINPNGQWAWLEQVTGYPLTKELVDLLERPLNEP